MIHNTFAPFRGRRQANPVPPEPETQQEDVPNRPARSLLTYGSFDGFHAGHARWLGQLAALGNELIIGCATDAFCAKIARPAKTPFATRRAVLESCRFVSRVIALDSWDQRLSDIVNYDISIFAVRSAPDQQLVELADVVQVLHVPTDLPHIWTVPRAQTA